MDITFHHTVGRHPLECGDIEKLRTHILNDAYEGPAGELRWKCNDRVVPLGSGTFETSWKTQVVVAPPAQKDERRKEVDASLAKYRANPPKLTGEQQAEARAAHGSGVKMVDLITGETWTT